VAVQSACFCKHTCETSAVEVGASKADRVFRRGDGWIGTSTGQQSRQFSLIMDGTALMVLDHRRHQYSINHKDTTLAELSQDSGVRAFLYWNFLDSEAIVASLLSPSPYDTLMENAISLLMSMKIRTWPFTQSTVASSETTFRMF
jgi:hypothetical protein